MTVEPMRPGEFDAVYRLLEESFPPEEYRPYAGQKALPDDPRYKIFVCRDAAGDVEAMMALWRFSEFTFIEHFAVAPASRCRGLGGEMLSQVLAQEKAPVCLEAELPTDDITRRRIGFYKRNGFYLNDYPYLQPSLGSGREPVPLMILTTGSAVNRQTFERLKNTLYRHVYRVGE